MDSFNSSREPSPQNPYALLLNAFSLIPTSHFLLALAISSLVFFYNFLEFHVLRDFFSGFRGSPIRLTYHPSSLIYKDVVSKCGILRGRYLVTPWLSSPHIQTCFLNFFGRPPVFNYRRQIFHASDGGTIALDWLFSSDVGDSHTNSAISKDDPTPIVVVIPGLTSDSASAYMKHLAFGMAKSGWNVVISNHRGLGGVSVTSDCFYNAGWTEDIRVVINYLHDKYPTAPLFAVGTSIGANLLVKYLGEDKEKTPIAGAAAICNPWDLVIGDRFICRKLVQKLYDRALAIGLQGYAQLHEPRYSRLANWEGIKKSRSIRDFDNYATCLVGKFETVDTYYRYCSSSNYVGNVSVPLLCISALDDPVCTVEAIPWDECRANQNIVLATSQHGGHLAFFEGLSGTSLWWVRAVAEFLSVLQSSPHMHLQKKQAPISYSPVESSIDQGPYVNVAEDGMLAAVGSEQISCVAEDSRESKTHHCEKSKETLPIPDSGEHHTEEKFNFMSENAQTSEKARNAWDVESPDVSARVIRRLNQISRQNRRSIWLLAFVAIVTSWPLVGSALSIIFRRKQRNVLNAFFR